MKLENNIAFVTGGGRSIGRAICLKLAEEGADVVIANSSLEPANEVGEIHHRAKLPGVRPDEPGAERTAAALN